MELNIASAGVVVPGGGPGGSDVVTITFELELPSDYVPGGASRMGRGQMRKRFPDQSEMDTLLDLWPAGALEMMLFDSDFDGVFEQDPGDSMLLHYTDELVTTGDILWTNVSVTLDLDDEIEMLTFPPGSWTFTLYGENNSTKIDFLPEPSGALMLGVGACVLVLLRRVSGRG